VNDLGHEKRVSNEHLIRDAKDFDLAFLQHKPTFIFVFGHPALTMLTPIDFDR
jgi:hypothetical protein